MKKTNVVVTFVNGDEEFMTLGETYWLDFEYVYEIMNKDTCEIIYLDGEWYEFIGIF